MKVTLSTEYRPKGTNKPVRRCSDWNKRWNASDMDYYYVTAKSDGKLIGQACIEKDTNYMFSVSVDPKYQGLGLGKQLVKRVERYATGDIYLRVYKENLEVLGFYKELGYEVCGEDEEDFIMKKASEDII